MLLIPVGLEDRPLRAIPWVTLGLILVNSVALVITVAIGNARSSQVEVLDDLVRQQLEDRPYLSPDARVAAQFGAEWRLALAGRRAVKTKPAAEQVVREQRELDALVGDYLSAIDRLPWHRFGFVSARPSLWTVFTSMFMHGGWLHLLGNMLFLYVAGSVIEDVYGRLLYLAAYLVSGIAAVAGQYLSGPDSQVPLVGASGAIAGVMGMVLVRLVRSRIQFLLLPIPILPNLRIPLTLPAALVLPLWFGEQFVMSQQERGEGGGVAFWAHIAGFVFGVALAGGVALLRLEERVQGRTAAQDDVVRLVERTARARLEGDLDAADERLGRALAVDPNSVDAWHEAYELALLRSEPDDLTQAMTRLLELMSKRGDTAGTLELLRDEGWQMIRDRPARLDLTVAAAYERLGDPARALDHYAAAADTAGSDPLAVRALVRQGELLGRMGKRTAARETLQRARSHGAMTDTWETTIARALARLDG